MSIRVSADGFSLYTYKDSDASPYEQQHITLVAGEMPHITLERTLSRIRLIELQYDAVDLVVDSPTTHIPLEEFQREEMETLYRLTFPDTNLSQVCVCYEILPFLEVVEFFSVNRLLLSMVEQIFPGIQIRCLQGRLLEAEVKNELREDLSSCRMHVCRISSGLFLYIIKQRKLHFACTYSPKSIPDAVYYTAHVWKVMQFDVQNDTAVLHGCRNLAPELGKYIKNIKLCEL